MDDGGDFLHFAQLLLYNHCKEEFEIDTGVTIGIKNLLKNGICKGFYRDAALLCWIKASHEEIADKLKDEECPLNKTTKHSQKNNAMN